VALRGDFEQRYPISPCKIIVAPWATEKPQRARRQYPPAFVLGIQYFKRCGREQEVTETE
jgi:hypothetical protein